MCIYYQIISVNKIANFLLMMMPLIMLINLQLLSVFCKIGKELTDKVPHINPNNFLKYMRNPISSSLLFEPALNR